MAMKLSSISEYASIAKSTESQLAVLSAASYAKSEVSFEVENGSGISTCSYDLGTFAREIINTFASLSATIDKKLNDLSTKINETLTSNYATLDGVEHLSNDLLPLWFVTTGATNEIADNNIEALYKSPQSICVQKTFVKEAGSNDFNKIEFEHCDVTMKKNTTLRQETGSSTLNALTVNAGLTSNANAQFKQNVNVNNTLTSDKITTEELTCIPKVAQLTARYALWQ